MGIVKSNLELIDDQLLITYTSGSFCPEGTEYTTKLMFFCDENKNGQPILVSSINCTYTFKWMTKYACPIKRIKKRDHLCVLQTDDNQRYFLILIRAFYLIFKNYFLVFHLRV